MQVKGVPQRFAVSQDPSPLGALFMIESHLADDLFQAIQSQSSHLRYSQLLCASKNACETKMVQILARHSNFRWQGEQVNLLAVFDGECAQV